MPLAIKERRCHGRRIIKEQPVFDTDSGYKYWDNLMFDLHDDVLETMYMPDHCPHGEPGDILWVRETFLIVPPNMIFYKADPDNKATGCWKPSIFMPKEACRIKLMIKSIRVERLQDISDEDAKAEGVDHVIDKITGYCGYDYLSGGYNLMTTPYHGYRSLWKKINGIDSWDKNPWVWVIEFKKL